MRFFSKVFPVTFFAFLSILVFRQYFFEHQVPFPANLLVAYYDPWRSYPSPEYPNGPPNKPLGFDNLRIFYPLRSLTIEELKQGKIPLWNPYSFSGNTQLATYQSAVFHPLSFLFLLIPQIDAWSIIIILQPFFASLFMYLFLKSLNLDSRSSFFGAVTFALSGFMIVWWEESFMVGYSALFLPLILFGIEKIIKGKLRSGFALTVFGLVGSILSGWFQMTLYVLAFCFAWILFRLKQKDLSSGGLKLIIIASFISLSISAVHLLPTFESFFYSVRASTDAKYLFNDYLLPLTSLSTLVAPDFFGNPGAYNYFGKGFYHERVLYFGLIPLLLVIYELLSWKKSDSENRFFSAAFLITLSLGLSLPTSWFLLYRLKLPLISVIIPSRIFFLTTFSASILTAYGAASFFKKLSKKQLLASTLVVGLALLSLGGIVIYYKKFHPLSNFATVSFRNLILPALFFLVGTSLLWAGTWRKRFRTLVYFPLLAIFLMSSFYFANKYLYFSQASFVFPKNPVLEELAKISGVNRFVSYENGHIESNFSVYYRLFSPEGYDSFYIKRYGELLHAAGQKGKFSSQIPRADAKIESTDRLADVLENPYRKRLLSLLGVRYILGSTLPERNNKSAPKSVAGLKTVWEDEHYRISEFGETLPRAFLVKDYEVARGEQEILDKVFAAETDLAKTVILEEDLEDFVKEEVLAGDAQIVSYLPEEVTIKTKSDEKAILFLSDNYYPGWKAFVDGNEKKIFRANYSFRAVVVPAGEHQVRFSYQPLSFSIGVLGTFLGLIFFMVLLYIRR